MKKKTFIIIITAVLVLLAAILVLLNQNRLKGDAFSRVPNDSELLSNMKVVGLIPLASEGNAQHTHQHLAITINGQKMPIPKNIGIGSDFISPIHTHEEDGIIHVESPVVKDFTLGQFFTEWGVRLNNTCIGSYCADNNNKLLAAVNGIIINNPENYILTQHAEIELWYGPKSDNPSFKGKYDFPPNL